MLQEHVKNVQHAKDKRVITIMKISTKRLRQIIREELVNEINGAGLPAPVNDFNQIGSLQKGFNDLTRSYENTLIMQAIVHNNQNASQMSNDQLDQLASEYAPLAKELAAKFKNELMSFLEDHFVESLRSFSRGQRAVSGRQETAVSPPATAKPAGQIPQRRATDTIVPPSTQRNA